MKETKLEHIGIQELIEKLLDIPAKVSKDTLELKPMFPAHHSYSKAFIEENTALIKGSPP